MGGSVSGMGTCKIRNVLRRYGNLAGNIYNIMADMTNWLGLLQNVREIWRCFKGRDGNRRFKSHLLGYKVDTYLQFRPF